MDKKDYDAIAEILIEHKKWVDKGDCKGVNHLLVSLSDELANHFEREDIHCECGHCPEWFKNHRFNRQQFLKACGVK